jgi:hypothetical protein
VHSSLLRRLLPLLLVLPCWPLPAYAGAGLYAGQVPVGSQADEERAGALRAAFAQVVVKVSGDAAIVSKPDVAKAIANADKYVQQYQYAQDVVNENGQPQVHLSLIAQFDRDAVDRLLAEISGAGRAAAADAGQAAPEQQSGTYRVWVSGIASAEDYARLIGALSHNELIRNVQAEQARADGVQLKLEAASSLSRLLASLGNGPVHVLNAKPPVEGIDALLGMQSPN